MTTVTIGRTVTLQPSTVLNVTGGTIRLDETGWPYATADLEIPAGDDTLRAALDPLQQPQPRISIAVTRDLGAQARTFDLGVREILETASGRTWRIRLASDEAAAAEWSSPQEIGGGTTIRAVIANMTSGTGTGSPGPGTSIAATPAWDADVNVTADAENAWTDPRLVTLALTGGGCTATRSGSWPGVENGVTLQSWRLSAPTSSDSFLRLHADEASLNGHAVGERWMYSADLNIEVTQSGTGHYRARRLVAFLVVNGTTQEVQSQEVTLGTAGQTDRAVLEFTVPLGTTAVFVRAYHGYTVGTVRWGKIRASRIDASPHRFIPIPLDPGKVRYDWFFTGSDTDTALYDYGWTGKADESASRRRALTDIRPEAVWREAGELGWPKIAALLQTKGWRLVCDETRTWTIRDDTDTTPGTLVLKDTTAIIDADTTTSRDDDTWFDSARVIYAWESGGIPYTITEMYVPREDGDYLPMTKTRTIQVDGPYPGPGRAKAAVQRAQRRGRRITTRSLTDWTVTPSQAGEITIGTTVSTGRVQRVEWDLADDSMRCEIAIGA